MANQSVVLDLDTLANRPTVVIAGTEYRLYTIDLLPPIDNYRVRKLLKRVDELLAKEDLSPAEEDELAGPEVEVIHADGKRMERRGGLLDRIVRLVLDAPDDIHEKLHDRQRVEIVLTFHVPSLQALLRLLPATAIPETAPSTTGASSPPPSAGSTQP